jgi:N-acetylglucosamine malate deacetylase 2
MNLELRTALVVAHPDDEVVGSAGLLLRARDLLVVHVTDGAPRNGNDARAHGFATVEQYAATRVAETMMVLEIAGLSPGRWIQLGHPDQGAIDALDCITRELARLFVRERIEQVVTHPYEGGHPDHDSTACAVHRAATVPVIEMTSYHAGPGGTLASGCFLDNGGGTTTLELDAAAYARKQAMLAAHATQARTLAGLPCRATERYRPAPAYDFRQPPHAGRLLYERYPWGVDGPTWRARANRTLEHAA